jgi:citrate synthase
MAIPPEGPGKPRSIKSGVAVSTWLTATRLSPDEPASLITAREAVQRLGVKPATLYAYVSRGLLRSASGPEGRERRYYAKDVERLKQLRHSGRRSGAPSESFDPKAPVLDSAVCLIDKGRIYYRGVDAVSLADRAGLEEIACLLWEGETPSPFEAPNSTASQMRKWLRDLGPSMAPLDRARSILIALASQDVGALDISPESVVRTGGRLVPALAAAMSGALPTTKPIHEQLAAAWGVDASGADLIRRCLVLSADHELNTSTYVARCVASTAASPYAAVIAGLGALAGPRHGGQAIQVESLLRGVADSQDIMGDLVARLQRGEGPPGFGGERIPGFGHPLYPNGDPRAAHVLDGLGKSKYSRRSASILNMARQVSESVGRQPNFDFALAAVAAILALPPGSALGIFAVGRTVGWIAHAMEQYASQTLIRPRARYVGVLPTSDDVGF